MYQVVFHLAKWFQRRTSFNVFSHTMFPAGGHLGLEPDLPDTIWKGDHPRTIVAKLGFSWPSSFRGEDLWMKSLRWTDGRTTTQNDGKSSPWLPWWAKKSRQGQICQIASMLKFIFPTQRSCGGYNVFDQSESPSVMFCERFSSKTIERNFLKHGSF